MLTFIPELCIDNSQPFSLTAMIRNISEGYIETMFCCGLVLLQIIYWKSYGNFAAICLQKAMEMLLHVYEAQFLN